MVCIIDASWLDLNSSHSLVDRTFDLDRKVVVKRNCVGLRSIDFSLAIVSAMFPVPACGSSGSNPWKHQREGMWWHFKFVFVIFYHFWTLLFCRMEAIASSLRVSHRGLSIILKSFRYCLIYPLLCSIPHFGLFGRAVWGKSLSKAYCPFYYSCVTIHSVLPHHLPPKCLPVTRWFLSKGHSQGLLDSPLSSRKWPCALVFGSVHDCVAAIGLIT